MPRPLLALSLLLLTAGLARAEEPHRHSEHAHGEALAAHEHGIAQLNLALDGEILEIEFASPATNLVGFEHAARNDAERARVAEVRARLEQPLDLFGVPSAARCRVREHSLHGALFEPAGAGGQEHSEIEARYRLQCSAADALQGLNLAALFGTFPATQKIQVQLIGPRGQQGLELSPERSGLTF
ncbi:DUF2796 domain-containing protein [Azotobacter beijerinckii]|uniref:DUF2796 domain-containing protein n=1 Tax=Azotobacter beijerinckii TaxID=170623 RepID=A0A1I3ZCA4_9GAMM|nr:DUF2796 domain-containing protein [Azotobacter beijerinckii]SFA81172.1 Protein of unknown function [Azotobacter beijerinckii]SFK41236.1 Protein of unknown function [Azotobacter beijerinckii]